MTSSGSASLKYIFLLAVSLTAFLMSACVSNPATDLRERAFENQLEKADYHFSRGNYQNAQLLYSSYVYSSFSTRERIDYAIYQLGLSHYLLGEYKDAYLNFAQVAKEHPGFSQMDKVNQLIAQCKEKLSAEKEEFAEWQNDVHQNIVRYEEFLSQDPENAEYHFKLGDYYWEAGRFNDAIQQYRRSAELNPDYLNSDSVRKRVRITQDGDYVMRTPELDTRNQGSLRVQADLERVYRDNFLGEYQAVRISGYIENTGVRDVGGVSLEVTIYDFYDTVEGTRTIQLGFVPAGGRRPFSVLFDQFRGEAIDIKKYTTNIYYNQ